MVQNNWLEIITECKKGNNAPFNRAVSGNYPVHFKGPLITLTGSEEMAWEVYLNGMTKFWERFVLHNEALPDKNIKGYIFRMVRNNFVDESRKLNKKTGLKLVELDHNKLLRQLKTTDMIDQSKPEKEHSNNQKVEQQYLVALENAISKLCDDCKKLIERNIYDGERLKTLKTELNYTGSYQTIVEKKKRCIKKVTKLFFKELVDNNIQVQ